MVSKEFFERLNIKNIYFRSFGGITTILRPENFTTEKTTVVCGNELPDKGILTIDTEDKTSLQKNRIEIFVSVIKDFSMNNSYTLFFEDPLPQNFEKEIKIINDILKKSDSRREFRYDIGMNNWNKFGLTRPDLNLLFANGTIKCIISNASIHGAMLTGNRSMIKIGDKASLLCDFEKEKLKLPGIVISAESAVSGYFRYSIRFLEPLSLSWCNHIVEYGDYLENQLY